MKRTRIAVVTGSRAEYGLLYWTLRRLSTDHRFDLRLVVTGMHLISGKSGSWRDIVRDGFVIHKRVNILTGNDSAVEIARRIGRATEKLARTLSSIAPDVVLILGDRYEILATATACLPLRIPVAHIHGGESTRGAIDDQIRHSVTKLSHVHFCSTPLYGSRIRQMGEEAWRVHVVGATGVEYIHRFRPVSREHLAANMKLDWSRPVYLFTYHPATLQVELAAAELREALAAIAAIPGQWIITGTNRDTGGRAIWSQIVNAARKFDSRVIENLGQDSYLSLMKWATAMVGNSSSGLLEAPSFGFPAVNIGDRQAGRIRGRNVIDVRADRVAIRRAIIRASSQEFRASIRDAKNPYDRGSASRRIVSVLARLPERQKLIEKPFHDSVRKFR